MSSNWPVIRQLAGDPDAEVSERTRALSSRLGAEGVRTHRSVCPYCAVGCGTLVHERDGQVIDVEGDPASPINGGTLCPKGASIYQYAMNPRRVTRVKYRRPKSTEWEEVDLDWAMERIARLFVESRERDFVMEDAHGRELRHTQNVAFLGGAALDNEENYLIKKFCIGTGLVFVENQARI
jgi:formate dehydrogenase major subunit